MRSLRILIADDEAIIRLDLREALEQMGHAVVAEAGDGREAVARADALDPDLVFLDVKMPGMDGLQALREMNERKLRPVIFLSAYSDRGFVEQAVELGAKAYIVKPFQAAALMPAIQLAVAHFREMRTLREENASLRETLEANRKIQRAKALLMKHEKLTEEEAFTKIQRTSMDQNRRMIEVADAVLLVYGSR